MMIDKFFRGKRSFTPFDSRVLFLTLLVFITRLLLCFLVNLQAQVAHERKALDLLTSTEVG
jgi:hypothetical protein